MKPTLEKAFGLAVQYLDSLETRPLTEEPDPNQLRQRLQKPLTDEGMPPLQVIEELVRDAEPGLLHSASGRFFGWVIGGGLPAAVAADWLTSVWDQNAAAYACSPSAAIIEEVVGEWLKQIFGLPDQASFAFVTGCQMAHVTGLAAARHKILADRGWDVEKQGLCESPAIRVLVGEHHETLLRAVRRLGIGTDAVHQVAQRDDGIINLEHLREKLEEAPGSPTIVALAAGDLNRGLFDPFDEVCHLAHQHGAWVHVDGAFGLWVRTSERYRDLARGIEMADSWATDAHKWLNVPYDSGIAFVADPQAHRASMTLNAAYKIEVDNVRDQFDWGPEWSRRARAIPLYAALRSLGRNGVGEIIESCCELASELVEGLAEFPEVEVLAAPVINQGLVRFLATDGNHDAHTERVIDRINRLGVAWFGPTTWQNKRVMRISVSNFRTSGETIDRVLRTVREALDSLDS